MKAISNETLHVLLAEIVKDINSKVSVENLDNLVTEYLKAHPQEETDITETVLKIINDNIDSFPTISNYNFKIGAVTTVNPSQDASVSIKKDDSKKEIILNFGIPKGAAGANGKSAYEIAVQKGFTGNETQWLESLKGKDGVGKQGAPGVNGKSAYEVAVENGFKGTVAEWLESLKGKDGGGSTSDGSFTSTIAQDLLNLFMDAAYANDSVADKVHKYAVDTNLSIPATGITLSHSSLAIEDANELYQLVANVTPHFTTENVIWTSADENIATIKDGIITPVANGVTTISAAVGSFSANCEVDISAIVKKTVLRQNYDPNGEKFYNTSDWDATNDTFAFDFVLTAIDPQDQLIITYAPTSRPDNDIQNAINQWGRPEKGTMLYAPTGKDYNDHNTIELCVSQGMRSGRLHIPFNETRHYKVMANANGLCVNGIFYGDASTSTNPTAQTIASLGNSDFTRFICGSLEGTIRSYAHYNEISIHHKQYSVEQMCKLTTI